MPTQTIREKTNDMLAQLQGRSAASGGRPAKRARGDTRATVNGAAAAAGGDGDDSSDEPIEHVHMMHVPDSNAMNEQLRRSMHGIDTDKPPPPRKSQQQQKQQKQQQQKLKQKLKKRPLKSQPGGGGGTSDSNPFAEAERPTVRLSDVGGVEQCLQMIRELIEWPLSHPEVYAHLGVAPPRGVLLHGPPGCGKTLLSHAIAVCRHRARRNRRAALQRCRMNSTQRTRCIWSSILNSAVCHIRIPFGCGLGHGRGSSGSRS